MRWLLTIFIVLAFGAGAMAYNPKPGEVVLRLSIQNRGEVFILLRPDRAPLTVNRVMELTQRGFYDGQRFFRVVNEPRPFLVQIGDPDSRTKPMDDPNLGLGGTGERIPFEDSGLRHERGAVGFARHPRDRTGDCQFYIMLGEHRFLDGQYTVFGRVVEGMDVVQSIRLGDRLVSAVILRG